MRPFGVGLIGVESFIAVVVGGNTEDKGAILVFFEDPLAGIAG